MTPTESTALEFSTRTLDEQLRGHLATLQQLQDQLVERELALFERRQELAAFERRYRKALDSRYRWLEELLLQITKLRGEPSLPPGVDPRGLTERLEPDPPSPEQAATAKQLYRNLARKIHPDLADGPEDRARRTQLMALANVARDQGDIRALEELLEDWELSPERVLGTGTVPELTRVIRRINQLQRRLTDAERELCDLDGSHLSLLRRDAEQAEARGIDLLASMASELEKVIVQTEDELQQLQAGSSGPQAAQTSSPGRTTPPGAAVTSASTTPASAAPGSATSAPATSAPATSARVPPAARGWFDGP